MSKQPRYIFHPRMTKGGALGGKQRQNDHFSLHRSGQKLSVSHNPNNAHPLKPSQGPGCKLFRGDLRIAAPPHVPILSHPKTIMNSVIGITACNRLFILMRPRGGLPPVYTQVLLEVGGDGGGGGGSLRTLTSMSEIRALGWNSSLSLNWGPRHPEWP